MSVTSDITDMTADLSGQAAVKMTNNTLASYAIGLLVTLIVLLVTALVGGEFASAIPTNGTFSEGITQVTDSASTAFVIFGVSLLILPAVAAVVLIVRGFGGMMGGGGNGGMGR
jgi:amino acid transporter